MSGQDTFPMTPLDQMVSSESLQILKAAVPYAPPSARKLLSVFAKFQEFKTALSLFPDSGSLSAMSVETPEVSSFEMLEEIRQEAASRGIPYTALLPSDDGLISFYQKRGYHSFFSSRTVSISRAQLTDWAAKRESDAPLCDYSELWDDAMTGSAGSVHWPLTAITRALSLNSVGGESVATMGDGFAIWREHDGCADVREWIAFRGRSDYLARGLRLRSDCDEFRFRLPVYSEDFPGQGVVHYAGMLRSTDGRPLPRCDGAYLGLELD